MSYRLRTLGGVTLSSETGVLDGSASQRRRLALLSLMATAGEHGVTRDRLIGLLWPDSEPAKARQVLTQWLHLIRRDLGDDALFLGTANLRLNPERISADVTELEVALEQNDLERAAALYAGPFLDGFYLTDAPEFEHWAEEERARLATRMRGAYDTLSRRETARGDHASAVRWAECAVALDPLDSRATLAFLRALASAGDRGRVLRHARVHAELVRDQLDADVDPAIAAFVQQVRATPVDASATEGGASTHSSAKLEKDAPSAIAGSHVPSVVVPDAHAASIQSLRRWRWWRSFSVQPALRIVFAAGVVVLLLGLAALASRHPEPAPIRSRVMVTPFENATGDTSLNVLGLMAADWIIRGVGETGIEIASGPAVSPVGRVVRGVERDPSATAGTLITGRFYLKGDSLAFQARIEDARSERVAAVIGPVLATRAHALDALETLRRRVMGSVAELVDERYSTLASLIAVPPSFEAFREVTYGDAAADRRHQGEAVAHYQRAAAFDTTYLYPVVQIARANGNMEKCGPVDSVARVLEPKRDKLTRYEALLLDRQLQMCSGDLLGAYRSAKALYEIHPSGSTTMYLARNASALNRSREVIELLLPNGMDALPTRLNSLAHLTLALHALGQYRRELQVSHFARERFPDLFEPALYEVRALAALGDIASVRRVATTTLGTSYSTRATRVEGISAVTVAMLAGHELGAHGHPGDARAVARELGEWLGRHPPAPGDADAVHSYLLASVGTALDASRWDEAQRAIDLLAVNCGDCLALVGARGTLAAYRGDVAEAHRISELLAGLKYPYLRGENTHARAQIAAILGEREGAVSLLRDAFAEGLRYDMYGPYRLRSFNHALPEFAQLRGYPPFEELVRPKD